MSSKPLFAVALGAALLFSSTTAFAAAAPGPKARLFAKFDTNKNGVIDGDEVAALRKAFADEPTGDLARYDSNKNGKLDDAEITAIKPPGQGEKKGAKKSKEDDKGGAK